MHDALRGRKIHVPSQPLNRPLHLRCPGSATDLGEVEVLPFELERRSLAPSPAMAFAKPKSSTFTVPVVPHLDVRGLQVPVDDPLLVCCFEGFGDLLRDGQGFVERNWSLLDPIRQRWPFD